MKVVLRNTKTDKILTELLDNVNYKLTDEEIDDILQELASSLELNESDFDDVYVDYV